MKIEEILQLVDSVSKSALAEFKYEEGGVKLSLKKADEIQLVPGESLSSAGAALTRPAAVSAAGAEAHPAADTPAGEKKEAVISGGKIVKSPLVGTFYTSPSEDAEPFVSVGDSVKEGQIVAIVEAMKLMNDIESDFTGTIAEILVQNGDTVEYGQPLFVIV